MRVLPSGTITFFLTDIEGSSRLWEAHPDAMRGALARHDAILTEAIEQNEGIVVKSRGEGDAFFSVFARSSDAVAAACSVQQALAAESWPTPTPIRVRIAIHTGEADLRDGDYYGPTVNRCARLRGICHGGQTILSAAEEVFQVLPPGAPDNFPPLKSLNTLPNNLPSQTTRFIGRERELAEARKLLGLTRLLTLTGMGGTGKTRLSLQLAAEMLESYPDGIWVVELANLSDPALVATEVATVLGVRDEPGRSASPGRQPGRCRRSPCPTPPAFLRLRRSLCMRRFGSSSIEPRRPYHRLRLPARTVRPWRRSATGWTASRWRLNWRRRG